MAAARAWQGLRNPASTAEFYASWLALLCGGIPNTTIGVLLLKGEDDSFVPAGIWPDLAADVTRLGSAAERALTEKTSVLLPATSTSGGSSRVYLAQPILLESAAFGVVVLEIASSLESDWRRALEQLAWSVAWPEGLILKLRHQSGGKSARVTDAVTDVLRASDQHERFEVAAVLVANRIVDRLGCDRVAIGLENKDGLHIEAISHSAAFDKKSELSVALVAVMQEAFDQYGAVAHPPLPSTERRISVSHRDFADKYEIGGVASVILKAVGQPFGVLTLEWPRGKRADEDALELASTIADAIGPVIELKHKQSRLISGRLFETAQESLAGLLGPSRLTLKLSACATVVLLGFMAVWPAQFRVSAKAVLEGAVQRAAVAPFDGFIARAPIRAGDLVKEGQELAALDDRDLLLEKLKWETERQKLVQKQRDALAKHERTNQLVLGTQVEQAQSQLDLVLERLKRARISAPIDGIVVSGDLTQMLGGPVTQGKVLFEIAPLSTYRLILQVDERDVSFIDVGKRGSLLLTGAAGSAIDLEVTKMTSVATAEDGRNFFRVEARIDENGKQLRPGMEGIAKVEVDRRSLLWIWFRPVIDRFRLFVWAWTP